MIQETEIIRLAAIARLGFEIVPIAGERNGIPGLLCMGSAGIRFEPFDGSPTAAITWEEFDKSILANATPLT